MGNTYFNNKQIKDIFLNNQRFKKMYLGINVIWDFLTNAFSSFKSRVLADAGTFENDNSINDLTAELLQEASLVITPNGVKTSKLYAIKPEDGSGDLTVIRATTATRINASGIREVVPANTARIDYSTGKGMILVEPQRTNLIRNSTMQGAVVGTPGTLPTNWASSLGLTQTIVSKGVENGLNYIDYKLSGTAVTVNSQLQFEGTNIISASIGQDWSASVYLKIISSTLPPTNYSIRLREATATGTFVADGLKDIFPTTSFQKFSYTRKNTGATTERIQPMILFVTKVGQAYDFTVRIYAPQMEQGSNATSYIPTTTSTVTRNADVINKSSLSGITTITETFENGTTNVISGSPTSYTMSQGRIKKVIGI